MTEKTETSEKAGTAHALHHPDDIEGTICIELDYRAEVDHAVDALHERADQLERRVENGECEFPDIVDNRIVDLRLMAEKIRRADPN